jgi:pyrroline-5-carboxylate reductase
MMIVTSGAARSVAVADSLPRLGFIGSGKMATALARGLLNARLTSPDRLSASDPVAEARSVLSAATGIQVFEHNEPVIAQSDVLVLAIKPQVMLPVLTEIGPLVTPGHLVISIAAGVTIRQLVEQLGQDRRVVRVMPNTPCLVSAGASAYSPGGAATPDDVHLVGRILAAVGRAIPVPESQLDAVTGLSGSGPGFVAVVIEALSDGGVRSGLPREVANVLAAQTVLGTAKMILETGLHPAALKDMVASPGGTTAAGLHVLERGALRASLMDAVLAAARRAAELGGGDGSSQSGAATRRKDES